MIPICSNILSHLSLKCVAGTLNRCSDGLFGCGTFDGEGVGRGTGLGLLYARYFLDGTDYSSLAMTAMHILNAIDGHVYTYSKVGISNVIIEM
jgi:hypothetical protein